MHTDGITKMHLVCVLMENYRLYFGAKIDVHCVLQPNRGLKLPLETHIQTYGLATVETQFSFQWVGPNMRGKPMRIR